MHCEHIWAALPEKLLTDRLQGGESRPNNHQVAPWPTAIAVCRTHLGGSQWHFS